MMALCEEKTKICALIQIYKYSCGHHSLVLFSCLVYAYFLKHTKLRWILVNI